MEYVTYSIADVETTQSLSSSTTEQLVAMKLPIARMLIIIQVI